MLQINSLCNNVAKTNKKGNYEKTTLHYGFPKPDCNVGLWRR